MKRFLTLLLAMVLLLGCVPTVVSAEGERTEYFLKDCVDKVKLIGRTDVNETGIVPHTTASGIAFYSDCSGDIELTVKGDKNLFDAQYFIVYVDGKMHKRVELNHRIKKRMLIETLKVAEGLEPGFHRIEILRETEEINAYCEFMKIALNGEMTPAMRAPMLIEFVGDSITTGYGAYPFEYADATDPADHPARQAGTKSYAYLTAQALGMDIQVCCTSGYGAQVGWNGDGVNMQDMYAYTAFHHNRTVEWPFERQADIVVINLGTNDNSAGKHKGVFEPTILEGMKKLTEQIKSKNPDAKIVWATGMMGICYKKGLTEMVEDFGGAEAGYYFCILPTGMSGGGGHPDEAQHAAASEVLIDFLKQNVLPEDYVEQQTTAEQMEALLAKVSPEIDPLQVNIAKAELEAFKASGAEVSGSMHNAYLTLLQQQTEIENAEANKAPEKEPSDSSDMIIILVVVIVGVVIVTGLIVFAILYRPKKKSDEKAQESELN